jgi:DNA-binding transcriptional ArsR family regulator
MSARQLNKAMGDPVRLRLLSLIASHVSGEACVCELIDVFDLSGPTISHHLKVLREAGLISGERRGTWVYYRVLPEALGPGSPRSWSRASPRRSVRECADQLLTRRREALDHGPIPPGLDPGRNGRRPARRTADTRARAGTGYRLPGGVSLPIALGLLVMMCPVLAKVRYDRLDTVTGDRWLLVTSLLLNWYSLREVIAALGPGRCSSSDATRAAHLLRSTHRTRRQSTTWSRGSVRHRSTGRKWRRSPTANRSGSIIRTRNSSHDSRGCLRDLPTTGRGGSPPHP